MFDSLVISLSPVDIGVIEPLCLDRILQLINPRNKFFHVCLSMIQWGREAEAWLYPWLFSIHSWCSLWEYPLLLLLTPGTWLTLLIVLLSSSHCLKEAFFRSPWSVSFSAMHCCTLPPVSGWGWLLFWVLSFPHRKLKEAGNESTSFGGRWSWAPEMVPGLLIRVCRYLENAAY